MTEPFDEEEVAFRQAHGILVVPLDGVLDNDGDPVFGVAFRCYDKDGEPTIVFGAGVAIDMLATLVATARRAVESVDKSVMFAALVEQNYRSVDPRTTAPIKPWRVEP